MGRSLNRYKFNTLVKAVFAYQAFSAVQTYRHLDQNTFMSHMARAQNIIPIAGYTGLWAVVCLAI